VVAKIRTRRERYRSSFPTFRPRVEAFVTSSPVAMATPHRASCEIIPRDSSRDSRSTPPMRARVEIITDAASAKVLVPVLAEDTILDVRQRVEQVIRIRDDDGGGNEVNRVKSTKVRLSIDGFELVDSCRASDVVRETDVVVARASTNDGDHARDATKEKLLRDDSNHVRFARETPTSESGSTREGESTSSDDDDEDAGERALAGATDEGETGKRASRSARRKRNKRAKKREGRARGHDRRAEVSNVDAATPTTTEPEPAKAMKPPSLGDYPAKPKPRKASDYEHVVRHYVFDEKKIEEVKRKRQKALLDTGAAAWESRVFASEKDEEEIEKHPAATSLLHGDIIAYKVYLEDENVWSPYYEGRVMRFEPDTGFVRLKPVPEDRVSAGGYLFFTLGEHAPKPFTKRGEFEGNFKDLRDVRIIAGRSVWSGVVPSEFWNPDKWQAPPSAPSWQPKQKETAEEFDAWLNGHRKIHEYQMANARKWDEEILHGDRTRKWEKRGRDYKKPKSTQRRSDEEHQYDEQQQQQLDEELEETEDMQIFKWPTNAEELQAALQAEWISAQNTASGPAPPKPGAPPPSIPGAVETARQPSPPPGSPPQFTPSSNLEDEDAPRASARPKSSRRPRGSIANVVARLRAQGDLGSSPSDVM